MGSVTFEAKARTKWHSHSAGQITLAISGVGYYQEKGKPVDIIQKGDAVKCPPTYHIGMEPVPIASSYKLPPQEGKMVLLYGYKL